MRRAATSGCLRLKGAACFIFARKSRTEFSRWRFRRDTKPTRQRRVRETCPCSCHGLAMEFHNAIDRERVEARCRSLASHFRECLPEFALRFRRPLKKMRAAGSSVSSEKRNNTPDLRSAAQEHDVMVQVFQAEYNALRPFPAYLQSRG